jgi:membrane protein implicated in regulation of membrane protease activity
VDFALAFAVLAVVVVLVVVRPLRGDASEVETEDQRRAALEAAKEGKYREIRDAELDREMGKLSDEDWRAVDRDLRAQAIAILHELDELGDGAAEERG